MNAHDQHRLKALLDRESDRMTTADAADALGISERHVRNLRAEMRRMEPQALSTATVGAGPSTPARAEVTERILELWNGRYEGFNQVFFTELLERDEGIALSRSTVRRLLAAANIGASKPQKRSRHRRQRLRRAQEGAMIQMDGSDHDWLGDRGPRLTLVGGIDDATGHAWAEFRTGEDTAGYFLVLAQIVAERGIPCSVYTDRTAIALGPGTPRSGYGPIPCTAMLR